MNSRSRLRCLLGPALLCMLSACTEPDPRPAPRAAEATASVLLAPSSIQLLEMAFKTACALPANPHIKARSRAQEEVVSACLDLRQPERATEYLQALESWRRGNALAKVGLHLAEQGAVAEAERCLTQAEAIAGETAAEPLQQSWRVDRISAGIARARVALGQQGIADGIEHGLDPVATAQLLPSRARSADAASFEATLTALDSVLESENFDRVRGALDACVVLFDRFYAEPERCDQTEHRVLHAYSKLPLAVRVDLVLRLVETALTHADPKRATRLLEITDGLVTATRWLPEDEIAILARLGALRHRAGDPERGSLDLRKGADLFEANLHRIVDIARAAALRAIAGAYLTTGQSAVASDFYRRAVDAGVENPNSRPRAEDLVATCLAMARLGFAPDRALWERMQQVERGLTDPW